MSGIYSITNLINGKRYIGQAVDIKRRWARHKYELRTNQHNNTHLQRAWNKYGEKAFSFDVIELCDIDELNQLERIYIDYFYATNSDYGYNCDTGGGAGRIMSDETKEKLRKAMTGRIITSEHAKKIGEASKRNWANPEYKARMIQTINKNIKHKALSEKHKRLFFSGWRRWFNGLTDEERSAWTYARFAWRRKLSKEELHERLSGKNNGMYGRHRTETEKEAFRNYNRIHQPQNKRVAQLNLDTGEIINIYISAREAERITGIDHSGISRTCNNKAAFAGGFGWKYIDKEEADNDRKTA